MTISIDAAPVGSNAALSIDPAALQPPTGGPTLLREVIASLAHQLARTEHRAVAPGPAEGAATAGAAALPFAFAGMDPSILVSIIQTELRDSSSLLGESQVEESALQAERMHDQEREALERAEEAGRRAERLMNRAPKWVKKFVSAVISAVGVIAAAYTGGASLGLAIAGAALLLAADTLVPLLEKTGAINAEQAGWMSFGLKVVGTVLMCCTGIGASSAANIAPQAVETAGTVARTVESTLAAVDGSLDAASAKFEGDHGEAMIDAGASSVDLAAAEAALAEEIDELGDSMEFFSRIAGRMSALAEAEGNARQAAVSQLA